MIHFISELKYYRVFVIVISCNAKEDRYNTDSY